MTPEELDRILAAEEPLRASSGFRERVMAAVATEPHVVRFPWLRFSIGVASSGVCGGAGTWLLAGSGALSTSASEPLLTGTVCAAVAVLVAAGLVSARRFLRQA